MRECNSARAPHSCARAPDSSESVPDTSDAAPGTLAWEPDTSASALGTLASEPGRSAAVLDRSEWALGTPATALPAERCRLARYSAESELVGLAPGTRASNSAPGPSDMRVLERIWAPPERTNEASPECAEPFVSARCSCVPAWMERWPVLKAASFAGLWSMGNAERSLAGQAMWNQTERFANCASHSGSTWS